MITEPEDVELPSLETRADKWLPVLDGLAGNAEVLSGDQLAELLVDFPDLRSLLPSHREPDGSLSVDDTLELRGTLSTYLSDHMNDEGITEEGSEY